MMSTIAMILGSMLVVMAAVPGLDDSFEVVAFPDSDPVSL
jgi:hypothetical protein